MSQAKTAKEVLIAARWILANVGWCQAVFARRSDGAPLWGDLDDLTHGSSFCSLGAIKVVETSERLRDEASTLLRHQLDIRDSIGFNDAPERTKEEILQWFDKAIASAT